MGSTFGFSGIKRSGRVLAILSCGILTGCGIVPAAVQKTTEVALLPARVMAHSMSRDARLMSRAFEESATRVGCGMEVGAASLNRSARALSHSVERAATPPIQVHTSGRATPSRTPAARTASRSRPPQSASYTAANSPRAPQPEPAEIEPPVVDILPTSTLEQLTEDQAGLQRAAQSEAFSAPVGEEIYWEVEGRTGTAMALSEDQMGSFVCRTFVQTLTFEDETMSEGETVMCRNESSVWSAVF